MCTEGWKELLIAHIFAYLPYTELVPLLCCARRFAGASILRTVVKARAEATLWFRMALGYVHKRPSLKVLRIDNEHKKKRVLQMVLPLSRSRFADDTLAIEKMVESNSSLTPPQWIRDDYQINITILRRSPRDTMHLCLKNSSSAIRDHKELVLYAIRRAKQRGAEILKYVSTRLQGDLDVAEAAIREAGPGAFRHVGKQLKRDVDFVKLAVRLSPSIYDRLPGIMRRNHDVIVAGLSADKKMCDAIAGLYGSVVRWVPAHANDNYKLLMIALSRSGYSLQHASTALRDNRDVVLAAVSSHGVALKWASPRLRGDRQVVLRAVQSCGSSLEHAVCSTYDFAADVQVAKIAIMTSRIALSMVSDKLRRDEDFMVFVAKKRPYLFEGSGFDDVRSSKRVVMEVVRVRGHMLWFADPELWKDPDVVLAAAKSGADGAKAVHMVAGIDAKTHPDVRRFLWRWDWVER